MEKTKKTLRKRIETEETYDRVRENNSEFGRAGKGAKILRNAVREITDYASDRYAVPRLLKEMSRVIKADKLNPRGQRNLMDGDLLLLRGFEFNQNASLSSVFSGKFMPAIDRAAGTLKIDIPEFVSKKVVNIPSGATHFKLVSAAAEIDFLTGAYNNSVTGSAEMAYGKQTEAAVTLTHTLTANSSLPLFLLLGVQFYQDVNGEFYELYNTRSNPACLVMIDAPAPQAPDGE